MCSGPNFQFSMQKELSEWSSMIGWRWRCKIILSNLTGTSSPTVTGCRPQTPSFVASLYLVTQMSTPEVSTNNRSREMVLIPLIIDCFGVTQDLRPLILYPYGACMQNVVLTAEFGDLLLLIDGILFVMKLAQWSCCRY